uniref:Uncharacterized protein n=1 Tax=Anopheles darlingi TaxID=43151 RepID=A0A2M4D1J2_ANODA
MPVFSLSMFVFCVCVFLVFVFLRACAWFCVFVRFVCDSPFAFFYSYSLSLLSLSIFLSPSPSFDLFFLSSGFCCFSFFCCFIFCSIKLYTHFINTLYTVCFYLYNICVSLHFLFFFFHMHSVELGFHQVPNSSTHIHTHIHTTFCNIVILLCLAGLYYTQFV